MISDDFIKSEMLAEKYLENIKQLKELLKQGELQECLLALGELEYSMQITLALGELYDGYVIN
ncbi:MAG: hypothetical protein KTR20_07600 [Cellvibrionaceae bacterium]|nr:hypothetical protein [Cellvibrionaceae bacterium]